MTAYFDSSALAKLFRSEPGSDVVRSAVRSEPIVAFAMPFASAQGRRVFSGGLPVQTSILGAFLRNASPIPGSRLALLDRTGTTIAYGGPRPSRDLVAGGTDM